MSIIISASSCAIIPPRLHPTRWILALTSALPSELPDPPCLELSSPLCLAACPLEACVCVSTSAPRPLAVCAWSRGIQPMCCIIARQSRASLTVVYDPSGRSPEPTHTTFRTNERELLSAHGTLASTEMQQISTTQPTHCIGALCGAVTYFARRRGCRRCKPAHHTHELTSAHTRTHMCKGGGRADDLSSSR